MNPVSVENANPRSGTSGCTNSNNLRPVGGKSKGNFRGMLSVAKSCNNKQKCTVTTPTECDVDCGYIILSRERMENMCKKIRCPTCGASGELMIMPENYVKQNSFITMSYISNSTTYVDDGVLIVCSNRTCGKILYSSGSQNTPKVVSVDPVVSAIGVPQVSTTGVPQVSTTGVPQVSTTDGRKVNVTVFSEIATVVPQIRPRAFPQASAGAIMQESVQGSIQGYAATVPPKEGFSISQINDAGNPLCLVVVPESTVPDVLQRAPDLRSITGDSASVVFQTQVTSADLPSMTVIIPQTLLVAGLPCSDSIPISQKYHCPGLQRTTATAHISDSIEDDSTTGAGTSQLLQSSAVSDTHKQQIHNSSPDVVNGKVLLDLTEEEDFNEEGLGDYYRNVGNCANRTQESVPSERKSNNTSLEEHEISGKTSRKDRTTLLTRGENEKELDFEVLGLEVKETVGGHELKGGTQIFNGESSKSNHKEKRSESRMNKRNRKESSKRNIKENLQGKRTKLKCLREKELESGEVLTEVSRICKREGEFEFDDDYKVEDKPLNCVSSTLEVKLEEEFKYAHSEDEKESSEFIVNGLSVDESIKDEIVHTDSFLEF